MLYVNSYDEDTFTFADSVDSLRSSVQLHPGRQVRYVRGSHTKLYYEISVICSHGWHGPYCDRGKRAFNLHQLTSKIN